MTAVNEYLDGFARGRSVDDIEDMWQNAYTSSYWRNGPVLNNALSGLDMALWDIKGKRANMPVYQLLVDVRALPPIVIPCWRKGFQGTGGQYVEDGTRLSARMRIQLEVMDPPIFLRNPIFAKQALGPSDGHMDSLPYLKATPKMFEHIRNTCGEDVELLHDVHERIQPIEAINLLKELEQYRPFFIEDPLAPEQNGYFPQLRNQTSVPIAMGELFNNPHEWVDLITNRLIDFIRVHITQAGGFTPSRKLATLGEWFGVRTAWHGPGDLSPVGHAANAHLDMNIHNFGIQESVYFNDAMREVFPGAPTMDNGYMHLNDRPGWGIDINEKAAAKHPFPEDPGTWLPIRRRDGTAVRP